MHVPREMAPPAPRGFTNRDGQPQTHRLFRRIATYYTVIPVAIIVLLAMFGVGCVFAHGIRKRRNEAKARHRRLFGSSPTEDDTEMQQQSSRASRPPRQFQGLRESMRHPNATTTANTNAASSAPVDRRTSVRSVMTLPPYSVSASNTEQILGREGDRDGIDVIVNMATEEHDEALRDEEMETLYQIREARRRQIAEREERRSERAAARQRRDNSALAEINERTRAANDDTTVDDLRQHASNTQDRRLRSVSSVSYADLGIARHDGSRVDVSNVDAENTGLLSDAASIGRASRDMTPSRHRRDLSVGSFVSVDSGIPSPAYPGSRSSSRVDVSRTLSAEDPGLGSSPEMVEADLGDESIPPPEYEEVSLGEDDAQQPPQYAEDRAEQLQVPETTTGRQRSSSYTGPLPDIVIGEAFSVDLGEAPTR